MSIHVANFENILQLSSLKERSKLDREIETFMLDEYKLNENTKIAIIKKDYQFPNINDVKTDKLILTRSQNTFSSRMHIHTAVPYFHKHDFVELLYVYRGKCHQYIDSFNHNLGLNEGDLFLMNQNVVHAIKEGDPEDIIIQTIIPESCISYQFIEHLRYNQTLYDFFFNAKAKINEYYHYIVFRNCSSEKIKYYVENIMTEYYTKNSFYEEALHSYLRLLLIELSRNYNSVENKRHKLVQSSVEIGEIMQYIYEHSTDVTLEELSKVFSFNTSYLSRIISENSNNTFQELLKKFRMEKAEFLLQNSSLPVEKIAQEVGYKNANVIFKGIREKYDITPLQYRKSVF